MTESLDYCARGKIERFKDLLEQQKYADNEAQKKSREVKRAEAESQKANRKMHLVQHTLKTMQDEARKAASQRNLSGSTLERAVDKFLTVKKRRPTVSSIRGSLALASLVNPAISSNKTIREKKSKNLWSSKFSFSSPRASFLPTNLSTTHNGHILVSSPIASSSTFIDLSVDSESDHAVEFGSHASISSFHLPPRLVWMCRLHQIVML